jgi:hypothetical protein
MTSLFYLLIDKLYYPNMLSLFYCSQQLRPMRSYASFHFVMCWHDQGKAGKVVVQITTGEITIDHLLYIRRSEVVMSLA